jgi:hypothetical protein
MASISTFEPYILFHELGFRFVAPCVANFIRHQGASKDKSYYSKELGWPNLVLKFATEK